MQQESGAREGPGAAHIALEVHSERRGLNEQERVWPPRDFLHHRLPRRRTRLERLVQEHCWLLHEVWRYTPRQRNESESEECTPVTCTVLVRNNRLQYTNFGYR